MTYSKQLIEKRDAELAKADALVAIAADEKRELSQEEDTQIAQTLEVVRDLDEQITRLGQRVHVGVNGGTITIRKVCEQLFGLLDPIRSVKIDHANRDEPTRSVVGVKDIRDEIDCATISAVHRDRQHKLGWVGEPIDDVGGASRELVSAC